LGSSSPPGWARSSSRFSSSIFLRESARSIIGYPHRYSTSDAQFVRSMGNLLGPPLVGGNAVVELLNRGRDLPVHSGSHSGSAAHDQVRDLHLLVGKDRERVRGGALRALARRSRKALRSRPHLQGQQESRLPVRIRPWPTDGTRDASATSRREQDGTPRKETKRP
jgi:hypothetical protein